MRETDIVILLVCAIYGLFEALCYGCLLVIHRKTGIYYLPRRTPRLSTTCLRFIKRFIDENGRGTLMEYDGNTGWSLRPSVRSEDGLYSTNARGARASREYPRTPDAGTIRITTFGDCLTFGEEVPEESTWQCQMERLSPNFEVINLGVDGYDPGQMLLRYRQSLEFYADQHVVVLALVSSNIYKPLNIFRPFYSYDHGIKLAKPGFSVTDGALRRIANPMESLSHYERLLDNRREELLKLGSLDHYHLTTYSSGPLDFLPSMRLAKIVLNEHRKRREVFDGGGRYREGSEALRTTVKIIDEYCALARQQGSLPLIVLFPLRKDIRRFLRKAVRPYAPLIGHFERMNYRFIDMLDAFKECAEDGNVDDVFVGRHYSTLANAAIARHLTDYIHRNVPFERTV
jgi:hypothetical protein